MTLLNELAERHSDNPNPFLIGAQGQLHFDEVHTAQTADVSALSPGDVVAVIGDFNAPNIATVLRLIDLKTILVPLTVDTRSDHPYFFENSYVDAVIEDGAVTHRFKRAKMHPLVGSSISKKRLKCL